MVAVPAGTQRRRYTARRTGDRGPSSADRLRTGARKSGRMSITTRQQRTGLSIDDLHDTDRLHTRTVVGFRQDDEPRPTVTVMGSYRHAPLTMFASLKLPSAIRRGISCHSRMTRRLPSGISTQFVLVTATPS